jgi:hypothetical protein
MVISLDCGGYMLYTLLHQFGENCMGYHRNNCYRIPKGQSKKDNPEKLAIWDIQDEDKPNKHTTQYVLDTSIHKQRK